MKTPQPSRGACGVPGCDDPDCPVEYGYCHCEECGHKTAIAKKTSTRNGTIAGEPLRFVHGHNAAAGPPGGKQGLVSANEAARRLGERGITVSIPELIAAARVARVPCAATARRGSRMYFYFDELEVARWLAEHVCALEGCESHALGASGFCAVHASAHALDVERERRAAEKEADRDWLTQEEAVEYVKKHKGCGLDALRGGRRREELHPVRDGNQLRYPRSELDDWTPLLSGGQVRFGTIECAYRDCHETFKQRHANHLYCSCPCMWAEREAHERDQIEAAKADFDLLEAEEFGQAIGLSKRQVLSLRGLGRLRAVHWIGSGGLGVLLFPRSEIGRYERWVAKRAKEEKRQSVWLEPESVVERRYLVERVMTTTGLTERQARAVVREQVRARRRSVLRYNAGARRKDEIRAVLLEAATELAAQDPEQDLDQLRRSVALLAWQRCPGWMPAHWAARRDPDSYAPEFERPAVDRVRKLLGSELQKALQIARKKSEAA